MKRKSEIETGNKVKRLRRDSFGESSFSESLLTFHGKERITGRQATDEERNTRINKKTIEITWYCK